MLGCPKETEAPAANLVSDAKRALAERDRRLGHYQVEATSTQGDQTATYGFVYRAPGRVKGTVLTPSPVTLSFDGTRFFKLSMAEKKLEAFELKLPQEKAALFLTTQFAPFVPEGFRTPLLPSKGVVAAKHADGVELIIKTADEGREVEVRYLLRLPSGDFRSKQTKVGDAVSEVKVEAEHCDVTLGLCVPKVVVQRENGTEVGRTTFTRIDLTAEVPNDAFTLSAPEGFALEKHELVETPAK